MGFCRSLLILLCLLHTLVYFCHGGSSQTLSGSPQPPCHVFLEVSVSDTKTSWCLENPDRQSLTELSNKLGFRPEKVGPISDLLGTVKKMACSFQDPFISYTGINNSFPKLHVICEEAATKPPVPTQRLPVTSPEPTGPMRFLLVEGKERLRCSGVVEFYRGIMGGSICYKEDPWNSVLGNKICQELKCGTFLNRLETPKTTYPGNLEGLRPLPIFWEVSNPNASSFDQVFKRQKNCDQNQSFSIICSGFQPKVKSRLKGESSPCRGILEVHVDNQWKTLCGEKNWEEVCHEQHCGSLISKKEVSQKSTSATSSMTYCNYTSLSQCYAFGEGDRLCKSVMIECQDPNVPGLGAGTVMSIILTLILVAILLVVCGPVAYKKLEKKFRQKKQRQWIGPTGVNQNVSFHRNHTVTSRSQVENPGAASVDNEYSQPPRHSQLSAYPALEGALNRSSNPPDNSSDSDYDLHGAQRL